MSAVIVPQIVFRDFLLTLCIVGSWWQVSFLDTRLVYGVVFNDEFPGYFVHLAWLCFVFLHIFSGYHAVHFIANAQDVRETGIHMEVKRRSDQTLSCKLRRPACWCRLFFNSFGDHTRPPGHVRSCFGLSSVSLPFQKCVCVCVARVCQLGKPTGNPWPISRLPRTFGCFQFMVGRHFAEPIM